MNNTGFLLNKNGISIIKTQKDLEKIIEKKLIHFLEMNSNNFAPGSSVKITDK